MFLKFLILFLIYISNTSFYKSNEIWGATGHRVVGQIAENYLTEKAKKSIKNLLNGKSLASVSTFADDIKSDPKYKKFNPWHYVNIKSGENYDTKNKNKNGDVIVAIYKCIEILSDKNYNKKDKSFYLKLLVHFIGDVHQPLHVGRKEDRGGNDIKVRWFGVQTNLHRVWDSQIINSHQMSYTELSKDLPILGETEIDRIKKSNILDWVTESQNIADSIYNDAKENSNLGFEYRYKYLNTVKSRLLMGGLRLAHVLNSIFN